jgi:hypothetical protein
MGGLDNSFAQDNQETSQISVSYQGTKAFQQNSFILDF